ncbi:MAG: hypothetical protein ACW98F_03340 [Candidatus Hodarchaeales archaeon]
MKTILNLTTSIIKNFTREKAIVLLLVIFPILLVGMAVLGAPEGTLLLKIDDVLVQPPPSGESLSVIFNSMTAVVLVASITSFFISYQLRSVTPRLIIFKYSGFKIAGSFVLITFVVSAISSTTVGFFGLYWVVAAKLEGYFLALFLGAVIFSTIGLLIAELIDSKELGLFLILTISVIDTAFIENPVYSRRYNEPWLTIMPSHNSIQMLLRSAFETEVPWIKDLPVLLLYELILIIVYVILQRRKRGS